MPLDLFPYQEEGAAFLAGRCRAGLFDEPGIGKTAQAIRAMDLVGARRVIVVCPAAVREVWVGEIRKFSRNRRRVIKGRTISDLGLWLKDKADVLLLSYEMLARWQKHLQGDLFDVLLTDEGHYAKNPAAARTRALYGTQCDGASGVGRWAAHVWNLSGTPIPNDPVDIWPWMRFVGATTLTLTAFTNRYFKSSMGAFSARQTPRDDMVGELRHLIRQHSLRRTKEEAGLQIPPIWLTTQTVDGDTAEIRDLLRQWPGLEGAILEAIEQGGLSFIEAQHIATLRRLVGEAKAPAFVKLMEEELDNGLEKVVIMGVHKRALSLVAEGLARFGVVMIDGSVPEAMRVKAVEAFQNDPATRVFVGNVRAAGTGLTLTAAADIVMLESSWSPADNAQALMRVHRVGQEKQVRARFISLANSIDDVVTDTVARKTAAIAKIQPPPTGEN